MSEVKITVSGPFGCGKSAIAGEIEIALLAIGVPVRFADEKEMRSEKNMTHADWAAYLEMYRPRAVIEESIEQPAAQHDIATLSARVAELEAENARLKTPLRGALVAMKIASALPSVSNEYDFAEAISEAENVLLAAPSAPVFNTTLGKLEGALKAFYRLLLPIHMSLAERELIEEPLPDTAVLFSFMGSGASDQATVGDYREAMRLADAALSNGGAGNG